MEATRRVRDIVSPFQHAHELSASVAVGKPTPMSSHRGATSGRGGGDGGGDMGSGGDVLAGATWKAEAALRAAAARTIEHFSSESGRRCADASHSAVCFESLR